MTMASVCFCLVVRRPRRLYPAIFTPRFCFQFSSPSSSSSPSRRYDRIGSVASAIASPDAVCPGRGAILQRTRPCDAGLTSLMASFFRSATSVVEVNDISPEDVLQYWFAKVDLANKSYPFKFWFAGGKEVDDEILSKFERYLDLAIAGDLNMWSNNIQGKLALVIILDQFSRNVFRGTSRAFGQDLIAEAITLDALNQGLDKALGPFERAFLYLPLMHSESLEVHSKAEQAFQNLADDYMDDADLHKALIQICNFERGHKLVLEKYGRFPSRNAILGRTSTPEEEAYLISDELWV